MRADMTVPGTRRTPFLRMLKSSGIAPAVPALAYLIVFMVVPICTLLLFGFVTIERGRIVGDSFTLQPLMQALHDPLVWRLMWRSFWVAVVSSFLTLILAYPVAYVYSEARGSWRTLMLVAIMSPLLTSALVRAYAWLVILGGRRGILNQSLLSLGLGYVSYTALDVSLEWIKSQIVAAFAGQAGQTLAVLSACGVGSAISIVLSAVGARMVLDGLTGGAIKKLIEG